MSDEHVWQGFTRAALDAAYNNMAAVPDSAAMLASWVARSDALRAIQSSELDVAYGPLPRNRFDVFRCGEPSAPLLVFIHGGWWQRNSKEVFSCMAVGPMAQGFDVALLGYTLAPESRLTQIASEIHAGLDVLMAHQQSLAATTRCILSGWSAGGHLTALSLDHPAVHAGLSISGVFHLEPIRHSYINDKLGLDATEVTAMSPALLKPCGKPFALAYGLAELSELQRQSIDYGSHCTAHGSPASAYPLMGHNHFSILEELAIPKGALVTVISDLCRSQ
ncbi:MAG: alpha/beta hydrolase [Hyphomicrobiaceae bacterium]